MVPPSGKFKVSTNSKLCYLTITGSTTLFSMYITLDLSQLIASPAYCPKKLSLFDFSGVCLGVGVCVCVCVITDLHHRHSKGPQALRATSTGYLWPGPHQCNQLQDCKVRLTSRGLDVPVHDCHCHWHRHCGKNCVKTAEGCSQHELECQRPAESSRDSPGKTAFPF